MVVDHFHLDTHLHFYPADGSGKESAHHISCRGPLIAACFAGEIRVGVEPLGFAVYPLCSYLVLTLDISSCGTYYVNNVLSSAA